MMTGPGTSSVVSMSLASFVLAFAAMWVPAEGGLKGDWLTPGGSVVRVVDCRPNLCLTLVKLAADVKVLTDTRNPNPALQSRPLCGLRIGDGFVAERDDAATGGKLYDPESGKTYSGKMTLDGERLKLRGYIGVSLFGRSEIWKRTQTIEACR